MDSKEAILSADAASDERFEMSQSIADFRIRSMMCAPLLDSEGKAFGALQIDTLDQRQRFTKEDLELLVSTASQAALAIQQAQLHEQALVQKEMERDMKLAREVQHGFLPDKRPEIAGLRVFRLLPADAPTSAAITSTTSRLPDGRVAVDRGGRRRARRGRRAPDGQALRRRRSSPCSANRRRRSPSRS